MQNNIFSIVTDYFRLIKWIFGQIYDVVKPIGKAVITRLGHNIKRMKLLVIIHFAITIIFIVLIFTPIIKLRTFFYLVSMASLGAFTAYLVASGLLFITCFGVANLIKNATINSQVEISENLIEATRGGLFMVGNTFDRIVRIIASIFGNAEEVEAVMKKKEFTFHNVPILGEFSGNFNQMISWYGDLYRKLVVFIVIDACVQTTLFFASWGLRLGAITDNTFSEWWGQLGSKSAEHPLNIPFVIAGILFVLVLAVYGWLKPKGR
jgi:hypothetical protein